MQYTTVLQAFRSVFNSVVLQALMFVLDSTTGCYLLTLKYYSMLSLKLNTGSQHVVMGGSPPLNFITLVLQSAEDSQGTEGCLGLTRGAPLHHREIPQGLW